MTEPTSSGSTADEAPAPSVLAAFRDHAHFRRGPSWGDHGEPIDIAEEFHEASKITDAFPGQALGPAGRELATVPGSQFALGRKTLSHTGPRVALAGPAALPVDFTDLVHRRFSGLPVECTSVDLATVGGLLGLAAGASPSRPGLRVTPSGGAMYPLDTVVVAHRVEGLASGAYVYDPIEHALLPRGAVDPVRFHQRVGGALAPAQPSLTFAVVATFARSRAKYGLRGYRFTLLEAGHLGQALLLAATAYGLSSLPWGGFADAVVDAELELDGLERSCVYLIAVSAPGGAAGGGHS